MPKKKNHKRKIQKCSRHIARNQEIKEPAFQTEKCFLSPLAGNGRRAPEEEPTYISPTQIQLAQLQDREPSVVVSWCGSRSLLPYRGEKPTAIKLSCEKLATWLRSLLNVITITGGNPAITMVYLYTTRDITLSWKGHLLFSYASPQEKEVSLVDSKFQLKWRSNLFISEPLSHR